MTRSTFGSLVFVLLLGCSTPLQAQVMQTSRLAIVLGRERALRSGATNTDIAHHIHYDITYEDRSGHLQQASYDTFRDPGRYVRIDVVAGDYRNTLITDVQKHQDWETSTGQIPLKIYDLIKIINEPQPAIYGLEHNQQGPPRMQQEMVDKAPYLCSDDGVAIRLCFDPFTPSFAFAQVYNQTFTYENWLNIGMHAFPAKIQIFDGKKVLVSATGKADVIKQFPKLFFLPDPARPQKAEDRHLITHIIPKKTEASPFFGHVQVQVEVDTDGKITKANALDFDDKQIVKPTLRFAKRLEFAPDSKNGTPAPFSTILYLQYFPED
jgi:hypothetical protein